MLPFDQAYLEKLTEDDLSELSYLDSLGFLVGTKETFEDFSQRLLNLCDALKEFEDKFEQGADEVEIFDGVIVRKDKRIPVEVIEEAGKITENYYRFNHLGSRFFHVKRCWIALGWMCSLGYGADFNSFSYSFEFYE